MAKYIVFGPDGKKHMFEGPEGATPAQVEAAAHAQFTQNPGIMGYAQAALSGVNRGALADLVGMPVDTMANVLDLGKAGIGTAYNEIKKAVTGKPSVPPEWTAPYDRSQVPGSGEWIAAKVSAGSNALGVPSPMDNAHPYDATARILHSGGRGAGASIAPMGGGAAMGVGQTAKNVMAGLISGGAGGYAAESSPEWSGVASMLPAMAGHTVGVGVKQLVRGGEAGRQNMAQRVQDLQNGGVANPSLGLATGSPFIMGAENLLSKVPGSVGSFQQANQANFTGMQNKLTGLRDLASDSYGPGIAGSAIQQDLTSTQPGVQSLPNRINNTYSGLLDNVVRQVGPNTLIPVSSSLATANALTTPRAGAPATTAATLVQPRIARIAEGLRSDTATTPAQSIPVQLVGGGTVNRQIPAQQSGGLPFQDVKDIRTSVGQELNSPNVIGTPQEGQYKQLYGAMADDLGRGAWMSDMVNGIAPDSGNSASRMWDRSNNYYSAGMDRMGTVAPFGRKASPEQAYNALISAAKGNVSTFQAVKKSINPDTRGTVAATYLDDMGSANSSQQNNMGNAFSPESYLTQYDKIAPGRNELLSGFPGSGDVRMGVDDIAHAASMLRDGSKIWANPSGSGGNVAASASLGGIIGNLVKNPGAAALGVGGLMGGNYAARKLLLNPDFVNYLTARPAYDNAAMTQEQLQSQRFINSLSQSQ